MGVPLEVKDLVLKHNINVFSSNYELYGDMSNRVMSICNLTHQKLKCILLMRLLCDLMALNTFDLHSYGVNITQSVKKSTKIPISIGSAPTKALAKEMLKLQRSFQNEHNLVMYWILMKNESKH